MALDLVCCLASVSLYLDLAIPSECSDDSGVAAVAVVTWHERHCLALVEVGYWRCGLVLLCLCTWGSVLKHGLIEVLSNANKESDLLGYPVL